MNKTYILLMFLLMGCNSGSDLNNSPELNSSEMTNILIDLHLNEAYVSQQKLNTSNTLDTLSYYKQLVFEKHQISESVFNQSMKYYTLHPSRLQIIYDKVKKQINDLDKTIPNIKEAEQSIKNIEKDTNIVP